MSPSLTHTVQEFFHTANWDGITVLETAPKSSDHLSPPPELHLNLSVADYLARNNWQGLDLTIVDHQGQTMENHRFGTTYSLTMSVKEFFQRMVWQPGKRAKSHIASEIKTERPTDFIAPPMKLNVQDLSDLM